MSSEFALSIGLIADQPSQLQRMRQMLNKLGSEPELSLLLAQQDWPQWQPPREVQAWLVCVDLENLDHTDFEDWLAERDEVVILADEEIPSPSSPSHRLWLERWQRKLLQLAQAQPSSVQWPGQLWLLAASTGGPDAVAEFLSELPADLDAAFVYLQHGRPEAEPNTLAVLNRHSKLPIRMARPGEAIAPAQVYMVAAAEAIALNSQGCFVSEGKPWLAGPAPNADQFIHAAIHRLGPADKTSLGMIVFSGMGEDSAAACRFAQRWGCKVWAQSPDSCISPYMPSAALQTGCVSYSASPRGLAQRLLNELVLGDDIEAQLVGG